MTFAPRIHIDRVSQWRTRRYRRAFLLLASYLLPDRRLRSRIGRWLRRIPGVAEFARTRLGMIFFDRILVPKFTKDEAELRTYGQDIRQIICENALIAAADEIYILKYRIENRPEAPYGRTTDG